MRTIGRDFGDTARKVYAVASGALGNGKTCVVNSDGTVSVVAASGGAAAFGTPSVFEAATTHQVGVGFDSNSNKIVVSYQDGGNSSYGTAIVGTVSGTSISFGTPVVFESATVEFTTPVFDSNLNKMVIGYVDNGNSSRGTAIVGTVSGTSISFGSATVFCTSATSEVSGVFDTNSNKIVFSYRFLYEQGQSRVGTVSGTSISFGTAVFFNPAGGNIGSTYDPHSTFDSNSNKVVIAYRGPNNDGYSIVGTVSGTNISFGTAAPFTTNVANSNKIVFDSNSNKVIIAYSDASNSGYGTGVVGTVSGTNISFGTPVVFESATVGNKPAVFDTTVNKALLPYGDDGNSGKGTYVLATVSGTSISFTAPAVFVDGSISSLGTTFDSNSNAVVLAYRDGSNSNYGTARTYVSSGPNLTSENFIGITPSAYPTGAGAEIQTKGAVNEEQSGLTAGQSYFVQTDGTLSTTAGDPSVFAGTAVSATKIIVKG